MSAVRLRTVANPAMLPTTCQGKRSLRWALTSDHLKLTWLDRMPIGLTPVSDRSRSILRWALLRLQRHRAIGQSQYRAYNHAFQEAIAQIWPCVLDLL